jgi:ABC-type Mn2+/Zn2+ transport systems, permease components
MDFTNTLAFVYEGVLAGLLIALSCSMVGVYLLMRRLSMLGAGISHSAFGGIAIAFLLGLEPTLFTLFYVALISVLLQFLMDSKRLPSDTILSLFFSLGTALAVIVSAMKENLSANIYSYLFGSLLAVSREELYVSLFVFFITALAFWLKYDQLFLVLFNEEIAKLKGINTTFINYLFVLLAGINIVLSIKVAGLLLSASFVALPSMTALLIAGSFFQTFLLSAILSLLSVFLGVVISLTFNIPPSGAIVMLMVLFFVLCFLLYAYKARKRFQGYIQRL